MKVMVFDVGGTEIKYSVMDEQMHRTDSGTVPTPQDTQAQFLDTVYRLYAPHRDEVTGIAMALPGFVDNRTGVGGGIIANGQLVRGVHFTAGEYSFVNTNAEAWDAPDQNMACQCSTSNLLKWYRARKALPENAPLDGRSFFAAADWLFTSRAGQAYMEGLPRCQIVPCAFSSEANQVGVAAAYFEAMQKKC